MGKTNLLKSAGQAFLSCCLIFAAIHAGLPGILIGAFGIMAAGLIFFRIFSRSSQKPFWKWGLLFSWAFTFSVFGSLLGSRYDLDSRYVVLACWLVAAVLFLTIQGVNVTRINAQWTLLALTWPLVGACYCIVISYQKNQPAAFHLGLVASVAALILCKKSFRMRLWGIQAVNTLILLLVGLPLADLYFRATDHSEQSRDPVRKYYAYENAVKHPDKFNGWWTYFWSQYGIASKQFSVRDPARQLPFLLKPGSTASLLQSRISINSRGFRGREISESKGSAYRIIVLGESTTFGLTYTATDKPWPELLELLIRDRLNPKRPVEIINAGIPSYDLKMNLGRLSNQILPLKPDMIISYHGYNGFRFIEKALPTTYAEDPPVIYRPRPLKLLANVEHSFKVRNYRSRHFDKPSTNPSSVLNPMETEYAGAYRDLINFAQSNHIRLVLANYSMAVNSKSDPAVIDFYRWTFPLVSWEIKANVTHTAMVKELSQQDPQICLVDTQRNLDGNHGLFIDLMHLTEEGEHAMADAFFAGIKNVLEEELSEANNR